jgi:hypothetical protein
MEKSFEFQSKLMDTFEQDHSNYLEKKKLFNMALLHVDYKGLVINNKLQTCSKISFQQQNVVELMLKTNIGSTLF